MNLPLPQIIQFNAPDEGWYWPDGQLVHGSWPPVNMPAVQVELQLVVKTTETKPDEHAVQVYDAVAPEADK